MSLQKKKCYKRSPFSLSSHTHREGHMKTMGEVRLPRRSWSYTLSLSLQNCEKVGICCLVQWCFVLQTGIAGILRVYDKHFLPNNTLITWLKNLFFDSLLSEHSSTYGYEQHIYTLVIFLRCRWAPPHPVEQKVAWHLIYVLGFRDYATFWNPHWFQFLFVCCLLGIT